jgi:hypothetical protein
LPSPVTSSVRVTSSVAGTDVVGGVKRTPCRDASE